MIIIHDTPRPTGFTHDSRSVALRALSPGGTNYVDFEGQGEQLSASSSDLRIINQRHSSEELQAVV